MRFERQARKRRERRAVVCAAAGAVGARDGYDYGLRGQLGTGQEVAKPTCATLRRTERILAPTSASLGRGRGAGGGGGGVAWAACCCLLGEVAMPRADDDAAGRQSEQVGAGRAARGSMSASASTRALAPLAMAMVCCYGPDL